jgi:hypothetical protein
MENLNMINQRTWEEFRETKLLWWINRLLHTFGWAIVYDFDSDGQLFSVFPARVDPRGFTEKSETEGFIGLTQYIKDNIYTLNTKCME